MYLGIRDCQTVEKIRKLCLQWPPNSTFAELRTLEMMYNQYDKTIV